MSTDSNTWEFWLKLIFVLACCMLVIVGIALSANVWTSCRIRKQVTEHQRQDKEPGPVVIQPWILGYDNRKKSKKHERDEEKGDDSVRQWVSRPISGFGLSYTNSDAGSASQRSQQTVLLPPRPGMSESRRPPLSTQTSITRLPSPPTPIHFPKGSKTSLSQFQEMPAEEAGHPAVSPVLQQSHLRPDSTVPMPQVYMPYRNIDSVSFPRTNAANATTRSSEQTLHLDEPLSATSAYSHTLTGFPESPNPEIDLSKVPSLAERMNDAASQITTIQAPRPLISTRPHSSHRPPYPPLNINVGGGGGSSGGGFGSGMHNIGTLPFDSTRACSEPLFRHNTLGISPTQSDGSGGYQPYRPPLCPRQRMSDGPSLPSPQREDYYPLLLDPELAPLAPPPLCTARHISELYVPRLEPRPVPARRSAPPVRVPFEGMRQSSEGMSADSFGLSRAGGGMGGGMAAESVGSPKMSFAGRMPRKLQKSRRSEGYLKAVPWLAW